MENEIQTRKQKSQIRNLKHILEDVENMVLRI